MSGGPYRVTWLRDVTERRIAGFMNQLAERGESTEPLYRAMTRIARTLAANPTEGESRGDYERVYFEPPLLVEYELHDDEQLVIVLRARYIVPRSQRD